MPTVTVREDISFYYTDSGPPADSEYITLFFIHGHTFHSGIFQRLVPLAASHNLRIICLNRREYPGSTPYSTKERTVILEGSDVDRAEFVQQQGVLIALFIDTLIQELSLPKKIAVAGWSMGNIFTIAVLTSIDGLPETTRKRLTTHIKYFFLFDPPSHALGIPSPPNSYVPLWDNDIPAEARGLAFGKWCSSYYQHGDLASRDVSKLNQRDPDQSKRPTVGSMTPEELMSVASFESGSKYETILVEQAFGAVLAAQTERAFFDPKIRGEWDNPNVWHVYGEASSWNCVCVAWSLEEKTQISKPEIQFKALKGANHFFMWDEPEWTVDVLRECMQI